METNYSMRAKELSRKPTGVNALDGHVHCTCGAKPVSFYSRDEFRA